MNALYEEIDRLTCLACEIDRLRKVNGELVAGLNMAVRYLEHPDVLAVTTLMAMPGDLLVEKLRAAIKKAVKP